MPYDDQRGPDARSGETREAPHGDVPTRESPRAEERKAPAPPPPSPPEARQRQRRPLIFALLALVLLAVVIGGSWYWYATRNEETTDDAYTDGNVVMVAPQVSGQVVHLAVNDNQHVMPGQVLIKIDPRPFIAARDQARGQLEAAEGQLAAAEAALDLARSTYPARLAAAQAQRDAAAAVLFRAQADLRRQQSLPRRATTQEAIDNAIAAQRQAAAQLAQADAAVREAEPVAQNIAQAEAQVKQLQGVVAQARAQLAQAELNLGWTTVTAPQEGWVTKRNVDKGNYVTAGTAIMSLVTPQVWITANFKETQLDRMRPGQEVDISIDAYPGLKLRGHVDSVQLGSGSKFTAFPPENATGNFVKIVQRVPVKIDIDSGLDPKLPLPLGISVEPTVRLK
jgi:membrane fusion protein (multidrug efflux system)